jgi:hypothetical protein
VRARQPRFQEFRRIPEVSAAPFHAGDWTESLLVGLSSLFGKAPSLDQGEMFPRIRRAIILHNEAYWLWDTKRPLSTAFFVLTLALAFEALFTPKRRPRSVEMPGISATVLQELKNLLLDGRHKPFHERGLKEWWNAFYGLRSRIAHGGTVSEDDFVTLGRKRKGRHHAMVARRMFAAVIHALLMKHGLCPADGSGLEHERYVKPALDEMVPNGVRFGMVSGIVDRGDLGNRQCQTELDDLLGGIQDWDLSFTKDQERRLTSALDRLRNDEELPAHLSSRVSEALEKVEMLRLSAEQGPFRAAARLL